MNAAEQQNIYRAEDWAFGRRRDLPTDGFVKDLHRRMLGDVWQWAGKFRATERNIGIPHHEIPMALRQLLDDTHVCGSSISRMRATKSLFDFRPNLLTQWLSYRTALDTSRLLLQVL